MTNSSTLTKYDMVAEGLNMNGNAINVTGSCSLCGKNSESTCNRCGDFYCSEFCQKKDWPNHRFICFPMPKLVKASCPVIVKEDFQLQTMVNEAGSFNIPNGSCVLLTAFKSSKNCFIRSTNPSTVAEYNKVLNEINEFGKKSPPLSEKPKNNSNALALRDGKWCRVQIIAVNKGEYAITYIDFGDISKRFLKDLRNIVPSLANLPCFIHNVRLKGIKYYSTQQKLLKNLSQYTNKEYKVVFAQPDNSGCEVELFQWGTDVSLNSLIQDLDLKNRNDKDLAHSVASSSSNADLQNDGTSDKKGCETKSNKKMNDGKGLKNKLNGSPLEKNLIANTPTAVMNGSTKNIGKELVAANPSENKRDAPKTQQLNQEVCSVPPFETISLSEKDNNCKLIIMDTSYIETGYIGCLLEKYLDNFKFVTTFLKEYNVGDQPYQPILYEYCLANYESEWYRAKVMEVLPEDRFLVVYIDFTNEMELTSESIRRYPMALKVPCCTNLCAIDGLPSCMSDKIQKFLEVNCAAFKFLHIDSVRIQDNVPFLKSNELLNKMRDCNLL